MKVLEVVKKTPCKWVDGCRMRGGVICSSCPAYGVDTALTLEEAIQFFKSKGFNLIDNMPPVMADKREVSVESVARMFPCKWVRECDYCCDICPAKKVYVKMTREECILWWQRKGVSVEEV